MRETRSLLQTDFYKLSMQQAVLHNFPSATVKYKFICRNAGTKLGFLAEKIRLHISDWSELQLTPIEYDYLSSLNIFSKTYLDYLHFIQLDPDTEVSINDINGDLSLQIEGPWHKVILYEVPLLAVVNQLFYEEHPFGGDTSYMAALAAGQRNLERKIALLKESGLPLIDFGTRRRFSEDWHEEVVAKLSEEGLLRGTSNVELAMHYDIKPIGTMAHEWISAGQAFFHPLDSQKKMLSIWTKEFNGNLGIALSDTLGTSKFVKDFRGELSKVYDGVRHDSGEPDIWTQAMLDMYDRQGIYPASKTIVFSDSLTVEKAIELDQKYKGVFRTSFGIGTSLTNDMGVTPLNIVIKLVEVNGRPVAKLSDTPSKAICDDKVYLSYLQNAIKEER